MRFHSIYRFAYIHIATVLNGYFTLLILFGRPTRQWRNALIDDDALLDSRSTTQQSHFPKQYHSQHGQNDDERHQNEYDYRQNPVELARRRHIFREVEMSVVIVVIVVPIATVK